MKYQLAFLSLFLSFTITAQILKPGQWRGVVHYDSAQVPFTFEVAYPNGEFPQITFINGQERRVIDNVKQEGDSLYIPLDPFDVAITTSFSAMSMEGQYNKYYRGDRHRFSAEYGKPRMIKRSVRPSVKISERLEVSFDPGTSNETRAVGLFRQVGDMVYGTIQTRASDYRYFEGIMDGDSLKLSCFDGAHAFAILGKKTPEGWAGEMLYANNYVEPWIGKANPEAKLDNPFEMVQLEEGVHKPYYDLLAAGNGKGAIDPSTFEGKVLIVQLFGTWCPNSHDQTEYLVDWYEENREKGIEILASSYEANYSQEYAMRRINEYIAYNAIPYQVVLGGRLSKTSAAMPFPFMDRIEAFPTLVIIDKKGYARYVCSYFNGPATGEYYEAFDQRFREIIAELLAE
ncbi:MAG: hypothetical protein Tsb0034_12270 [Ekhidna sp.]